MAITKIQSESLNLADTYAFTGTVTGAGGITNAQLFYHTAGTSLSSSYTLLPSWSEHNGTKAGSIGSNVSVASGKFSFSSTGIYQIIARTTYYATGSSSSRYAISQLRVSTNAGSSFGYVDESINNLVDVNSGNNDFTITYNNYILDVDDTANIQVAIYAALENGGNIENYNKATNISFVRLGDT